MGVILLLFNVFIYVMNRNNSRYPFVQSICILFILHDLFLIPRQWSNYIIVDEPIQHHDSLTAMIWINSISEFVSMTTYVHAQWMFAMMYHRITKKLILASEAAELEKQKKHSLDFTETRPAVVSGM